MDPQDDLESSPQKEDPQNISAGSRGSNPPSGRPDEKLGTSDLLELFGECESYYIDKTGLVEAFFTCKRTRVLVTGPRRFGKTINIVMLGYFFEQEVKVEKGQELSEEAFWEKVQSTDNCKLFSDHDLSITNNGDLMRKHFGRYPVISISFKCTEIIGSYYDAISFCRRVVSSAFQKWKCIELSLDEYDRATYNKWCKGAWDATNEKTEVLRGLQTLVKYVCKHFGKKVVLLIDEYDAVIIQGMLKIKSVEELERVIVDCAAIITNAVKEDPGENWVEYAFITGISHIAGGMGLSGSNVKPFTFLDNPYFVPYYGLTADEVKGLLEQTYKLGPQEIEDAQKKFNGYCSKEGLKMYNMWSVLEFASRRNENEATYEWQDTGMIVGLKGAFRFPVIKNIIETMLLNDISVEVKVLKCMNVEDVLDLVRIIRKFDPQNIKYPRAELFLSFILEQGYLSYVLEKPGHVMIPNEQIKEKIREKLTSFNIEVFGEYQKLTNNCRQFFLTVSEKKCDSTEFKNFYSDFEKYFERYAATWVKQSEENMRN